MNALIFMYKIVFSRLDVVDAKSTKCTRPSTTYN